MSYCSVNDVYDATGLDGDFLIELSVRLESADDVSTLIEGYISDATEEIKKLLDHPLVVRREKHRMDEDIVGLDMTRVYLGNYDETYWLPIRHLKIFNVQSKVLAVLRVYVCGIIRLQDDDDYAWSHTPNDGYIVFDEALEDGTDVVITYEYDPYENDNVPRNIKKACAALAGMDLIDFCKGIRQQDTDFDAQSESGIRDPTKDVLATTRRELQRRFDKAIRAEGLGWEFTPICG